MSQKQLNPANEFGPQQSISTGNKDAAAIAAKSEAILSQVDEAARLLAERNAVLDFAIERLGEGYRWGTGALGKDRKGNPLDYMRTSHGIDEAFAALLRSKAYRVCAIGALGSSEGIFSHKAIDEAVSAVSSYLASAHGYRIEGGAYGYKHAENVFHWNDRQRDSQSVVNAFRAAKSLPLRGDT